MLGIRRKVAAIVRTRCFDFVYFIFGETNRAQTFQAQSGANDDHQRQRNDRRFLPGHGKATAVHRADGTRRRRQRVTFG